MRKHPGHGRRCVKEHARLPCAGLLGVHSGAGRCGPRGVRPIRCVRSAGCPGGGMTGCLKPARQDDGRGRSAGADAENSDGGLALLGLPFVRERAACMSVRGRWTVAAGRASPAAGGGGAVRPERSLPPPSGRWKPKKHLAVWEFTITFRIFVPAACEGADMLFTKKAHRLFSCKWKLDTFTDSEEQKLVLALFYGVGIFGILLSRSSNTSLADRKTVHVFCCVTVFRRMDGRFGPVAECERNSATDAGAGRDDPPPMAVPGIARRSDAGGGHAVRPAVRLCRFPSVSLCDEAEPSCSSGKGGSCGGGFAADDGSRAEPGAGVRIRENPKLRFFELRPNETIP